MDIGAILFLLVAKWPLVGLVLSLLGVLVVAGQAAVVLTPSKADDEAWDKIKSMPLVGQAVAALVAFAPIQKK